MERMREFVFSPDMYMRALDNFNDDPWSGYYGM